ncbi:MAG: 4-oxalocrotonate tautomerase, partial [Pseudomonadota bacterium]
IIEAADPDAWFASGKTLAEHKLASFWVDIHVSDGTNTKDEKASFLATLFKRMGDLLGPLHTESYAYVHDARGDAYGFGGLTQERRYVEGKAAPVAQKAA